MPDFLAAALLSQAFFTQVATTPTVDEAVLATALNPLGLTIDRVRVRRGEPLQIGTVPDLPPFPSRITSTAGTAIRRMSSRCSGAISQQRSPA